MIGMFGNIEEVLNYRKCLTAYLDVNTLQPETIIHATNSPVPTYSIAFAACAITMRTFGPSPQEEISTLIYEHLLHLFVLCISPGYCWDCE